MQPRILSFDVAGANNRDIFKTEIRLKKSASWKRQRIVLILPAGEKIRAEAAMSWVGMAFPPNNGVYRMLAQGCEVGAAYSEAIESVLAHPELSTWEYICCLEHDNTIPVDGVIRLCERMEDHPEFAAIGGLYYTKGGNREGVEGWKGSGVAQIWGDPRDPVLNFRPQPPDPRVPVLGDPKTRDYGLVECCGTGQGLTLFRMSMFKDKRFPKPFFKTKNGMNGEGIGTQDLAFWTEARKLGYRCAIDCCCRCGHVDDDGFVW